MSSGSDLTKVPTPDQRRRPLEAILRKKAENCGAHIPDDVNLFIASNCGSNIRELEGAMTKVIAYSTAAA